MAKNRNDSALTKVSGVNNALAQFAVEDTSLDGMDQYRIFPRIKILQPTSDKELKKRYGEGAAIMRPGDALLCKDDEGSFQFVPHFFYTEFAKWSDLKDKKSPMIMERSFDPTSVIAKRAKDPEGRIEVYPGHEDRPAGDQMSYRYVEHLCFCGEVYGEHDLAGTPVALSFEKGEFSTGKNFISAIMLRKFRADDGNGNIVSRPVPLWAQVWEFNVVFREPDANRKWYGLDFSPPEQSIIQEHEFEEMLAKHNDLKELHAKNKLAVDHGEEQDQDGVTVEESNF